jgi:predicted ATPase
LFGKPNAEILSFDDGTISTIDYEETGHYQITKMFMDNRERLLNNLFGSDD